MPAGEMSGQWSERSKGLAPVMLRSQGSTVTFCKKNEEFGELGKSDLRNR